MNLMKELLQFDFKKCSVEVYDTDQGLCELVDGLRNNPNNITFDYDQDPTLIKQYCQQAYNQQINKFNLSKLDELKYINNILYGYKIMLLQSGVNISDVHHEIIYFLNLYNQKMEEYKLN